MKALEQGRGHWRTRVGRGAFWQAELSDLLLRTLWEEEAFASSFPISCLGAQVGNVAQLVGCLSSTHEALGLTLKDCTKLGLVVRLGTVVPSTQ